MELKVLHIMAEKAHGGVGRTIDSQEPPGVGVGGGQVTNIRTFLISHLPDKRLFGKLL